MTTFKWLASFALTATMLPALPAKTHCPGNVASVPLRVLNGYQMIVPVSVNHSGPYQFLLDTGMQITLIDQSLADELHLEAQGGAAVVAGAGSRQAASIAQLDLLEAGSHAVPDTKVLVYDLQKLHVQGILGEDFLQRFDMLIDNEHNLLCLDDSAAMRADVRGPHAELMTPAGRSGGLVSNQIIVEARLSDATRPVRLMLDSGANGAILYNASEYLAPPQRGHLQGTSVDGRQRMFTALPPQNVKIGSFELSGVPFFSLGGTQTDARAKGFDGVLTLALFRRVFVAHTDHFAVLEPR
jgi:predicted aspartyl protease